jgi:hypothetical protein
VNGGWISNDEACTYYEDIITQFEVGHEFLLKEFNHTTVISWQMDPFGHSAGNAIINMGVGFEFISFARIHYLDKEARKRNRALDIIWQPILGDRRDSIFTHILSGHYNSLGGMCW